MADYAIHDTTLIAQANILRKKFGTSDRQDPADYASKMNLMGLLEEKTQSSASVCAFEDGADDVPTSSVKVTIPPTLSGVSAVTETQTGKTVFYPMDIEQGSISGSGYNSNSTTRIRTAERKAVFPSTEYKIKVNSEVQIYEVHEYTDLTGSSTHLTVNASEYTFTTKSTTNFLRILFRYSNNATITPSAITELQVTDENFFWKTYTASLGRTIYGGQVDIVNGTGTDENGNDFTFTGQEVPTKLGYNAFWSDEGDTEVTYRSSGTITPVLPTLISKTITENDTYLAEDDNADGYSEVIVNVSGGGGGSCERLFYARCYDNYQVEIPTISSLVQGTNYSSYVSYNTTTKKFTALQDFTAVIIGWVFTYQTYEASYSQGAFVVNNTRLATYTATGKTQGSTGGAYMVYNFKQGDEFYPYTPSTDGYPRQNCKVYLVSDLDDGIYTFADEEA